MTLVRYIKPLAVFYFLLAYAMLNAQGWEKTYGGSTSDVAIDLAQTADNGWLMVGYSSSFGAGDQDVYLVKTDVDGTEQWHRSFGSALLDRGNAIDLLSDGSMLIAGNTESATGNTHGMIWKRNSLGDSIWSFKTQDSISFNDIAETPDGNIVAVGNKTNDTAGNRIFIVRIDGNGQLISERILDANDIEAAFELLVLPDNSFLIAGYSHDDPNSNSVDAYLAKISNADTLEWEKWYGDPNDEEQALCITASQNGSYYLGGFSDDNPTNSDSKMWLLEVEADGSYKSDTTIQIEGKEKCRAITQLPNSDLLLAGEIIAINGNVNGALVRTDSSGVKIWSKSYGGVGYDVLTAVEFFNNNIFLSGTTSSFGAGGFDVWLLRTDSDGNSLTHVVNGNVYDDLNLNCMADMNESGIKDWMIEIVGQKTFYANTDANGFYEASVEEGDYIVNLITPNPYWEPCTNGTNISFTSAFDTIEVNFPVQKIAICPFMTVDISTPFLRRCFSNTYVVTYCNSGTETATNSVINIAFDDFLTIDSSEVTLTPLGTNQYEFTVGTLAPFECGSFRVHTTVDCNSTVLGQTHCSAAKITPDTFCIAPNPTWDGSSLEVTGFCNGDSVFINVTNTGPIAMATSSAFIIIEDELLTRQGPVKLGGNQDTTIVIEAQGQTVRFEVAQPVGHPGNSQPAIAIEGCNGSPFSLGYVTQYPQDDGDNFVEIDCQENIGAYDPNDKRGFPKGYGTERYIENDTELEYLIRFQNTGTDTAFTVVIRDTLRAELNPSTLKPGSSSHPYDFEIYENGIIKFTFDQILLVDSFTNEPESHGFVKFKITPTPGLYFDTPIHNSADIYFDFNPPVITNQTTHVISSNFILSPVSNPNLPQVAITIAPNPFSQKTKIELEGSNSLNHQFQIFNALGKLVRTQTFIGNEFLFEKENLPKGVYFFNIKNDSNQLISTGKVVLQ